MGCLQLIRDLFAKTSGRQPITFPRPLPLLGYGKVRLDKAVPLLKALEDLYPGDGIVSELPQRMEQYDQASVLSRAYKHSGCPVGPQ